MCHQVASLHIQVRRASFHLKQVLNQHLDWWYERLTAASQSYSSFACSCGWVDFKMIKPHRGRKWAGRKTKLASVCTICCLTTRPHVSAVSSGLLTCGWWTEDVDDARRQPSSSSSDEDFIKELSGWKVGRRLALFPSFLLLWRAVMERASLWASGELWVEMPASPVTVEGRFNLPLHHRWRAFYLYSFMAITLSRREDYTGDKQGI